MISMQRYIDPYLLNFRKKKEGYGFAFLPKVPIGAFGDLHFHRDGTPYDGSQYKPLDAMYLSPIHTVGDDDLKDEASGVWYESKKNSAQFRSDIRNRDIMFLDASIDDKICILRTDKDYDVFDKRYGVRLDGGCTFVDWGSVQSELSGVYLVDPPTKYDWSRFYEGLNTFVLWDLSRVKKVVYYKNLGNQKGHFEATPAWTKY